MKKLLIILAICILPCAFADLMNIQGYVTGSGGIPASGDLRIQIYDNQTGGTLVYDSLADFNGSIVDGRYDVLLGSGVTLSLSYGQIYYLDMQINGEDLDFDGSERQIFQSNVGDISVIGDNNNASGQYSVAGGYLSQATGDISLALGNRTTASGHYSTALGSGTVANNYHSTAMGRKTVASGFYSTAMGSHTTASSYYSTAMGYNTTAGSYYSTATGMDTRATGYYSTAMGMNTEASHYYAVAMGSDTSASAYWAVAMGYDTNASGNGAVSMGYQTDVSGSYSLGMGMDTDVSGSYSLGFGRESNVKGSDSFGLGFRTNASGSYSLAAGSNAKASGSWSNALGSWTNANASHTTIIGKGQNDDYIVNNIANSFMVGYNAFGADDPAELFVTDDTVNISADLNLNDNVIIYENATVEGLMIATPTDAPGPCIASYRGAFYMDDSENLPCFCNGTDWVRFQNSNEICS